MTDLRKIKILNSISFVFVYILWDYFDICEPLVNQCPRFFVFFRNGVPSVVVTFKFGENIRFLKISVIHCNKSYLIGIISILSTPRADDCNGNFEIGYIFFLKKTYDYYLYHSIKIPHGVFSQQYFNKTLYLHSCEHNSCITNKHDRKHCITHISRFYELHERLIKASHGSLIALLCYNLHLALFTIIVYKQYNSK